MKRISEMTAEEIKALTQDDIQKIIVEGQKIADERRKKMMKIDRSHDSMHRRFVTKPGDVFTIKSTPNMICNSITIHVGNEESKENFWMNLSNVIEAWKLLKDINEIEARKVIYQYGDSEPIDYTDSEPYKYRFN